MRTYLSILAFALIFIHNLSFAQMKRERVTLDEDVQEVFWAPNLVGMETTENLGAKSLNVTIMHSFGIATEQSLQNFFGLDTPPNVRLGLDYGVTDGFSIGIGRTTFQKVVDLRTKITLARQSIDGTVPVNIAVKGDLGIVTRENNRPPGDDLNYLISLPVSKKLHEHFSLQAAPLLAHFNTANEPGGPKNLYALGLGAEFRLSRRYAVITEYYPVIGERNTGTKNAFALGLNIETGGHVFQLFFASSNWHTEQYVMASNTDNFWAGDFRFGFNVNRIFAIH